MAEVLYLAAASAPATELFDFTDTTGASNPSGLKSSLLGLDTGVARSDLDVLRTNTTPGAVMVRKTVAEVAMSLVVKLDSTSFSAWVSGANSLARVLQRDDLIMVRQFTGETAVRYYEILSCEIPPLLRGSAQEFYWLNQRFQAPGLEFRFTRQPYVISDELSPTANVLNNSTFLYDGNNDNVPNNWTNAAGTLLIDGTDESLQVTHNAAVDLFYQDFSATAGTVWTASIEAYRVSGDRTPRLRLESRAGGTIQATTNVTATAWGTRISATGTIQGGDTAFRVKVDYTGGSTSTVTKFRRAQLESGSSATTYRVGSQTVLSHPMSTSGLPSTALFFNAGDTEVPVVMDVTADSGAQLTEVMTAVRSYSFLDADPIELLANNLGTLPIGVAPAVAGVDTSFSADGTSSGGTVAITTYAGTSILARRVRGKKTGAVLAALRGEFDIWVRVKSTAGMSHRLQLKWAPADVTPAVWANDPVLFNASQATASQWVWKNLGRIFIPESGSLSGVSLEFWSSRDASAGTGSLTWDVAVPYPADERVGTITLPDTSYTRTWGPRDQDTVITLVSGDAAASSWGAAPLSTDKKARLISGLRDYTTTDYAILPAGRHVFTFNAARGSAWDGTMTFRIVKSGTPSIDVGPVLYSYAIGREGGVGSPSKVRLRVTADGSSQYQAQAFSSAYNDGKMTMGNITDDFLPYVTTNETIESDADAYQVLKLDTSGQVVHALNLSGQLPFIAKPGLSVVYFRFGELTADGYAEHLSPAITRAPVVKFTHAPSYYM